MCLLEVGWEGGGGRESSMRIFRGIFVSTVGGLIFLRGTRHLALIFMELKVVWQLVRQLL